MHCAFCIVAASAADAATPPDAGVKAVDDLPKLKAEPILRWHGKDKRHYYPPPVDNPGPIFVRFKFGPRHPAPGYILFSIETIGTYFPPRLGRYKVLFAMDRNIRRDAAEASLLENGPKSVIALSNWTTNAQMRVSVTLEKAPPVSTVRSASGAQVKWSRDGGRITAEVPIGWGDFLVLE